MKKCKKINEFPEIMKEWDYSKNEIEPNKASIWSQDKYWWICAKGHSWQATPEKRKMGRQCHICSGQVATKGKNLGIEHPEFIKEWSAKNKKSIFEYLPKSGKKVFWICKNNHEFCSSINNRVKGDGCPYCSHKKASAEYNLKIKHPNIAKEFSIKNGTDPFTITCMSSKKYLWNCPKGHEYIASVSNRVGCHTGCPYCSNQKVWDGNRFSVLYPEISKEWDFSKNDCNPSDLTYGSESVVFWKCKNNHSWSASINNRTSGNNCPYCNKIELRCGAFCDSYIDAFYYLLFRENNIDFVYNQKYKKFGKRRFDFYIPEINTYIEVTSFNKDSGYFHANREKYMANIDAKRSYALNIGANFDFIQRDLTREEKIFVCSKISRNPNFQADTKGE